MNKPIYLIGCGKGGTGKSCVTVTLLDKLKENKEKIKFIETDTSNPDVYKSHRHEEEIDSILLNLDNADGWIDLINIADESPDYTLVINTAARNNLSIEQYGNILNETLPQLNRKLITLWVINRQRDCLEILKQYLKVLPYSDNHILHTIRNNYFGKDDKFELYNNSKLRLENEKLGGLTLSFPELADRVADELYSSRLSISQAMKKMPLGNKAELIRWQKIAHQMIQEIIEHG